MVAMNDEPVLNDRVVQTDLMSRVHFETLLADLEVETKPNEELMELARQYKLRLGSNFYK